MTLHSLVHINDSGTSVYLFYTVNHIEDTLDCVEVSLFLNVDFEPSDDLSVGTVIPQPTDIIPDVPIFPA